MTFLYPRLPYGAAERLRLSLPWNDQFALRRSAGTRHPDAIYASSGGRRVGDATLEEVASSVRNAILGDWEAGVRKQSPRDFDHGVGRILHLSMNVIPGDAAHEGVWAFLSLVLLPDVAALRFPLRPEPRSTSGQQATPHPSRVHGGHRNTFRRVWWRREILGDLLDSPNPLGEDELVGIFERSRLSRCRRLSRMMASHISTYEGAGRSAYARALAKRIRYASGPRLLDALDDQEMARVLHEAQQHAEMELDAP